MLECWWLKQPFAKDEDALLMMRQVTAKGVHTHLWTLQLSGEQDEGRGWKEANPSRWDSAFYHANALTQVAQIPT